MNRYTTLFNSLGALTRPGADPATLARAERALNLRLPEDFRELYRASDGLEIPDLHFEFEPLSQIEQYAGVLTVGFGYFPFTNSNDSNPYAICCAEPLTGFIVRLYHDDAPVLACRGLGRFLDLVVELRQRVRAENAGQEDKDEYDNHIDDLENDLAFDRPERSAEDARIGRELIRHASGLRTTDVDRGVALTFAVQMFGPGHEDDLERALALGDEYVREAVLKRCRHLGTSAAAALVRRDAEDLERFVREVVRAVEAAGIKVQRSPGSLAWSAEVGPDLPCLDRLYGNRHVSNWLESWLEGIRDRQWLPKGDPLQPLDRSGLVQDWVARRGGHWDHNDWLDFLAMVGHRFGPLPVDRVGLLLEQEKMRYWDRRKKTDRPGAVS
jgi:hypothetical protein